MKRLASYRSNPNWLNQKQSTIFLNCFYLSAFLFFLMSSAGCSQLAGSGQSVNIPSVSIECQSNECRTNSNRNPRISVEYTTSGCDNPEFGSTVSSSTYDITCTAQGCFGELDTWVNNSGSTQTLPSDSYSICARIDFGTISYPLPTTGYTKGTLTEVFITDQSTQKRITDWEDL